MNDLEQWLADVKRLNNEVRAFFLEGAANIQNRLVIMENEGRALGLKRSKIKSMLASVKLKVEMPEEQEPKE